MEKLKMQSRDVVGGNVERIAALFPHCVTERINKEGNPELAIDFEKLRAELSNDVLEDGEERYQFTWPDKRAASRLANEATSKTLRPCPDESVDFDSTENLYIEGDNLDVLKVLRETYLGKVKMIYIDPPYNTGNDFVYNDDFAQGKDDFEQQSGLFDDEGNQTLDPMQRNTEANGRFHTDWLNMIYPRLKVARDLLIDTGLIFISIDDNEIENLRRICIEIFGEQNFLAQMIWQGGKTNTARFISTSHEYILIFAKNLNACREAKLEWKEKKRGLEAIYKKREELIKATGNDFSKASNMLKKWFSNEAAEESKAHAHYCNIDEKGLYCMDNVSRVGGGKYSVVNPINGIKIAPPSRGWVYGKEEDFWKAVEEGILVFQDNDKLPILKRYLHDNETQLLDTVFYRDRRGARLRLRDLMGKEVFDFPKDEIVISNLIEAFSESNSIILDFFSGSATTAHAVMKLNAKDSGNRKFIMVQLPEVTAENSEARKAGYETICEIGKERIRRAGKKIKEQLYSELLEEEAKSAKFAIGGDVNKPKNLWNDLYSDIEIGEAKQKEKDIEKRIGTLDIGFRVLKLDSSNMEDVYYTPDAFEPGVIDMLVDNIKPDRTPLDLLFQVMLDLGIELSAKIIRKEIAGKEVFSVDDDYLLACFDKDVNETTIEEMAKLLPTHLVIRDSSAANDNVLDNFDQIIALYSNEKKINTHIL